MRHLERNEVIGLVAGIAVVVVIFGGIRMFPSSLTTDEAQDGERDGSGVIDISDAADENEVTRLLADAVTQDGGVAQLIIEDTVVGDGPEAKDNSVVSVHYVGLLQDGTQFDNSLSRGEPFTFRVGAGDVIPGWDQGVVGMKQGGERILVIPPDLAYGSRGIGPIPPNATLLFAIQLLEVRE